MKVYLSKLWIVNCIGAVVLIIAVTIAYIAFFVWVIRTWALFEVLLPTIVVFLCASFYVGFTVYLLHSGKSLIRYVTKTDGKLVMYSFRGEYLSSLDPKADFYYEILPLRDGSFPCPDYIILSNSPFNTFRCGKVPGLGKVCDDLDKDGTQIIMPCKENPYVSNLLNSPLCHRIW